MKKIYLLLLTGIITVTIAHAQTILYAQQAGDTEKVTIIKLGNGDTYINGLITDPIKKDIMPFIEVYLYQLDNELGHFSTDDKGQFEVITSKLKMDIDFSLEFYALDRGDYYVQFTKGANGKYKAHMKFEPENAQSASYAYEFSPEPTASAKAATPPPVKAPAEWVTQKIDDRVSIDFPSVPKEIAPHNFYAIDEDSSTYNLQVFDFKTCMDSATFESQKNSLEFISQLKTKVMVPAYVASADIVIFRANGHNLYNACARDPQNDYYYMFMKIIGTKLYCMITFIKHGASVAGSTKFENSLTVDRK